MNQKSCALVLNQDDVVYAESLYQFLKLSEHKISCVITVPSHTSPQSRKKYNLTLLRICSLKLIFGIYGSYLLKRLGAPFSKHLRMITSMKACSTAHGIPFYFIADGVNSEVFLRTIQSHQVNLILSVCSQIYRDSILAKPDLIILNFHAGLLPKNQGRFPIFWGLKNKDSSHGMTCHHIVKKIDAGPILFQALLGADGITKPTLVSLTLEFKAKMPKYLDQAVSLILKGEQGPLHNQGFSPFYGPQPSTKDIRIFKAQLK